MHKFTLSLTKFFHSSFSNYVRRISKAERYKFKLDSQLKQILIGIILGDAYMRRSSEKANVRITFRQGSKMLHIYYIYIVYFRNL